MKLLTLITLLISLQLFAKEKTPQTVTAELKNATVYYGYGAELNHAAKATLAAGMQEIIISNVATQPDINTIQIGCPENVVLMSYRFAAKTETKPASQTPLVKKMWDTLQLLQKQDAAIVNELATTEDILARTTKLIEGNADSNPKKEISSAELIKLVEYYTAKVETLKKTLYALQLKKSGTDEKINQLNTRINEINEDGNAYASTTTIGQIILQVMTKVATTADFEVSYFTRNAGWIPTYDVRVKTIDNSISLSYKASVTQTTGIDWKNVKLSLSTSNPNLGSTVPELTPWYLNLYVPVLYKQMRSAAKALKDYTPGTVVTTSSEGYAMMDEDKTVEDSNVGAYTSVNESRLYTSFDIDLPYDIPGDGKAYSVSIKDEQLQASYELYAIPKLDRDAFLVAHINQWEKLDLLPGDANIVMDNMYIGKSFIDPNTTTDTLSLSLGRDKRIAVTRMLVKELMKSKIKGDLKMEIFTYEITVRNNKKQAAELLLKDQYPLSTVKEIEIVLDDKVGAEVDADTGVLSWKVNLKAGESKKIRFTYSVKYPKDKVIQNLR